MIKYCKEQWAKNEVELRNALVKCEERDCLCYEDLVKLVVTEVLNKNNNHDIEWDAENITTVDNGDYQGTMIYLIPLKTYQPSEYEYLMAYVWYGSCSGCDTLQSIQCGYPTEEEQINDYVGLCRDIVRSIIKPYNTGWRNEEIYERVEE